MLNWGSFRRSGWLVASGRLCGSGEQEVVND